LHVLFAHGMDALDANLSSEAFGVANAIGHGNDQSHSLKSPITGLYDVGNDAVALALARSRRRFRR